MLLEDIATTKTNKTATRLVYDFSINPRYKNLGKGAQANAFEHKTKPNTVVKTIRIKRPTDGKFNDPIIKFIEICMQQTNPFLPRMYTAKMYETADSSNQNLIVVTMEKLHPLTWKNEHLFDISFHIFEQLRIVPEDADQEHPLYNDLYFNEHEPLSNELKYDVIFEMFRNPALRKWLIDNTPNRQLAKALLLINHLLDFYHADLHIDNLMFRLTGVGPQLVLMDPIMGD